MTAMLFKHRGDTKLWSNRIVTAQFENLLFCVFQKNCTKSFPIGRKSRTVLWTVRLITGSGSPCSRRTRRP